VRDSGCIAPFRGCGRVRCGLFGRSLQNLLQRYRRGLTAFKKEAPAATGAKSTRTLGRTLGRLSDSPAGAMFPVDHHRVARAALAGPVQVVQAFLISGRRGQGPLELPSLPMLSALHRAVLVSAFRRVELCWSRARIRAAAPGRRARVGSGWTTPLSDGPTLPLRLLIPFILFVLIPGLMPWWPGLAGPLLWLAAFIFTSVGRFSVDSEAKARPHA